jgi:hypothetical protein
MASLDSSFIAGPSWHLDLDELIQTARREHIENRGLGREQNKRAALGLGGLGRNHQYAKPGTAEKIDLRQIDGDRVDISSQEFLNGLFVRRSRAGVETTRWSVVCSSRHKILPQRRDAGFNGDTQALTWLGFNLAGH